MVSSTLYLDKMLLILLYSKSYVKSIYPLLIINMSFVMMSILIKGLDEKEVSDNENLNHNNI